MKNVTQLTKNKLFYLNMLVVFFAEGGRIRGVPVTIGGSSYIPPLSNEMDVKDSIREIVETDDESINIAIKLCLYCMKTQIFLDGNKRASVILRTIILFHMVEVSW